MHGSRWVVFFLVEDDCASAAHTGGDMGVYGELCPLGSSLIVRSPQHVVPSLVLRGSAVRERNPHQQPQTSFGIGLPSWLLVPGLDPYRDISKQFSCCLRMPLREVDPFCRQNKESRILKHDI